MWRHSCAAAAMGALPAAAPAMTMAEVQGASALVVSPMMTAVGAMEVVWVEAVPSLRWSS